MKYEILGKTVPAVEMTLSKGESVFTQSGGMTWQTEGLTMSTNARGGIMKSLGRMFTGESIFMSTYKADIDGAKVAFATTVPGEIMHINMSEIPNGFMLQKGAFLCAEENVELNIAFTKRFSAGLLGGEGLFLTKLIGPGKVIIQSQNFVDFAGRIMSLVPTSK